MFNQLFGNTKSWGRDDEKSIDSLAGCFINPASKYAGLIDKGEIVLTVNDEIKQQGDIADLIFTGTPAGVGALQTGDRVGASIAGLPKLEIMIE